MNKVQLSQICEVKKGQTITKKTITEGNIPVIAGGQQPAYYHNEPNRTGDVITVSGSGAYAGFVNFFTEPIFASDCTTIQSLDENKALTRYVFYLLKGLQEYIYSMQRGAGQPHVYPKDLVGIEIPLPPLSVQKQIVSILEKAENLKLKRNETNKETQKIIQSLFYEMFGDPFKSKEKLKQEKISKLISKIDMTNPKELFGSNSFKYLDISSIDRDLKKITSPQEILGIDAPSRARQLIKTGDLLISTVRPNLNSVSLVDKSFNNQICSTGYCVLRLNKEKILPEYMFAISKMKSFVDLLMSKAKGASYPAVSNKDITEIKINLPPLPLQEEFAKKVQLIESIQSKQQSSTEEINTLFEALMQKAFKGELC